MENRFNKRIKFGNVRFGKRLELKKTTKLGMLNQVQHDELN